MSTEEHDLHQRMLNLENELKLLKMGSVSNVSNVSDFGSPKSPKSNLRKERKPRAQTEYNKYVSRFISEQKEKLGSDFNHKVAFGAAAKTWTSLKNNKD